MLRTIISIMAFVVLTTNSSCKKEGDTSTCPVIVTDVEGNVYHTVTIGTQCWMKENLKTSHYRDGSVINEIEDSVTWANGSQTSAWCYFGQNAANNATYGKLYNWYVITDPRNVCPAGSHVPSNDEWITLTDYLGGEMVAGGSLKEVSLWQSPNMDATNSSGFSGYPGGYRDNHSKFFDIERVGGWWTSTEYDSSFAWFRYLHCSNGVIDRDFLEAKYGFSIRCIMD